MWILLKGTLMLRWPGLIVTAIVLASGTAVVAVNGSLLDAGIRGGHDEVISLSAVFGGLTIMIMVTLVCVAFSLTLAQRGAEMALGRAVGVSPGQLRSLVTLEALTIGLVSSSLGLVLSVPLSTQILAVMTDAGIAPASLEVPPRLLPCVTSVALGIVTSLVAGLTAVHRWAGLAPAEALVERHDQSGHLSPARALTGVAVLLGGLALSLVTLLVMRGPVASSTASPAIFLWAGGMALIAPVLVRPLVLALGALVAVTGVPGSLAAHGARARVGAIAPVAVSLLVAVGAALSLISMQMAVDEAAGGAPGGHPDVGGIVNYMLTGLIVAYATVSFVNTVILWALGSRRERTTFRALGATPLQSGLTSLVELLIGVLSGLILGAAVALVTVLPFLAALRGHLRVPDGTWALSGMVLGTALAVAMAVGAVVVMLTTRRQLTKALAFE
ncbi:ABC transporter permease [Nocardioides sp. AE5]|uniref:ABC transporter permease n=1 Tax=Nocardioides sp. AE5 TaxID=2962573 RepID=UPI0028827ABD|nr:ABC transporter permease [Nocardioides sp. AE5]MDT0201738.1 ABC transporter permease [Nocardioides sp. AE5]